MGGIAQLVQKVLRIALPIFGGWDNLYYGQKEKMNCSLGAQSPIFLESAWLELLVFKKKVSSVGSQVQYQ